MSEPIATSVPKKILVIDDETDVTELLSYTLKAKGFSVETLNDPNRSIGLARSFLPTQICRMLRADPKLKRVPVIFLTAKAEESDRIQGLETGADDYLCKPFSTKELVLRIQTILRRVNDGAPAPDAPRLVTAGRIVLDCERHSVAVAKQPVELTATEFKLLRLLMERRGRVQTREHLLINVWNYETEIETRTVDTHVRRLREKLGIEADWIETIRGVGYRFAEKRGSETADT
ncbi:MAG: DNA-binding response regulator [Verrucomicrobia bacterium]|nr:MAG: DNA-binding response regulator [Verrucomicrobiota bacterium]